MSPYEAKILIACCSLCDPVAHFPVRTELRDQTLNWLLRENLIDQDYNGTERGKFWMEAALNTPLPVQKWVIPEGK